MLREPGSSCARLSFLLSCKTFVFFLPHSALIVSRGTKTAMDYGQCASGIPLVVGSVAAGFPSPAEGMVERRLDLNETLIRNPVATFFVRVSGESMIGAGICRGDLLVVDRSVEARDRHIVIARLDGEYTVKRLRFGRDGVYLVAENPDYRPIPVSGAHTEFEVWGVVVGVVRALFPL